MLCYRRHCGNKIQRSLLNIYHSTEARDRSFYPTFNKRFDHLEAFLIICRPKKVLSAGSLCGSLVPSPQSKYPKRTFMLPQKYHVSVSNILSKPLKCFMENENMVKPSDPLQSAGTRALLYLIISWPNFLPKILAYFS